MSFTFKWPEFSPAFHSDAAEMLSSALNRGDKPRIIADDIRVEDINMGKIPPELEILEIGELSTDRFRGIFRLTYAGDAHLTLSTKVQANPLTRPSPSSSASAFEDTSSVFPSSMPSRGILFAARPLVVPMKLRLSAVRLKAIVVLVVSKQKGITLVFKNDPLDSVDVSSTFDSVAVIQKYLQQEIEGQLREMFREDLPGIIHRMSQRWLSGDRKNTKGSTAPASNSKSTASKPFTSSTLPGIHPSSSPPRSSNLTASSSFATLEGNSKSTRQRPGRSSSDSQFASPSTARSTPRRRKNEKGVVNSTPPSPRMTHRGSSVISSSPRGNKAKVLASDSSLANSAKRNVNSDVPTSFGLGGSWGSGLLDEMENYDPTYGLRPDEVRMSIHQSGYSGLAKLAKKVNGGLRDLTLTGTDEEDQTFRRSVAVPEDALLGHDDVSLLLDEEEVDQSTDQSLLHDLDVSDDDVPDFPASDEDNDTREDPDFNMYGYPSLDSGGIAFSDTTTSIFGSPKTRSMKSTHQEPRSQSHYGTSRPSSVVSSTSRSRKSNIVEYETIPAVGGGIITRPRIYHSASRVQAPDLEDDDDLAVDDIPSGSAAASSTARGPSSSRALTIRPSNSHQITSDDSTSEAEGDRFHAGYSPTAAGDGSLDTLDPEPMDPRSANYRTQLYRQQSGRLYRPGYGRHSSRSSVLGSSETSDRRPEVMGNEMADRYGWSTSRSSTAPTSTYPSTQLSSSSGNWRSFPSSSPPSKQELIEQAKIKGSPNQKTSPYRQSALVSSHSMTLGASHNFMDLVNSNHTLSPYTRTLDTKGFAVRSHPVTPSTGSGGDTSSSAGGMASKALSSTSSNSQKRPENGSYFDRHSSVVPSGGVRRRTFKLSGKGKGETSDPINTTNNYHTTTTTTTNPKEVRPDMSPIQHGKLASRAHSAASVNLEPSALQARPESRRANSSHGYGYNDIRSRSGNPHSERIMTMGAIRE